MSTTASHMGTGEINKLDKRLDTINNLAYYLFTRYRQLGNMKDLKEAITYWEQALELSPPGHPGKSAFLNNLASGLYTRYEQLGQMKDLEKAIISCKQALELHPLGHPHELTLLNHLASSLSTRYEQLGKMKDLEEAIAYYEQILQLCPTDHPNRFHYLGDFACTLSIRYEQLGQVKDLEEAITYYKQALELCPPDHPNRSTTLNNFADGLFIRYAQLGQIKDLEEVIIYSKQILELRPPGHPSRFRSLSNLASGLSSRYKRLGQMKDLEESIIYNKQALELRPPGHPNKSISLDKLADGLYSRYEQLGQMKDLEEAIVFYKQTLQLRPTGHPDRFQSLNDLACALSTRYVHLGQMKDFEEASANFNTIISSLPPNHPIYSSTASSQAMLLVTLHESPHLICHGCFHIEEACLLYRSAAHHATSSFPVRFKVANQWAHIAHNYNHPSAIDAYSKALDLQQQHLALLPSILSQQKLMEDSTQLSSNAASWAISAGKPEVAVQFLEQGRSILWSKIQGYRQNLYKIAEKDPKLAHEFQILGDELEHNAMTSDADIAHQRKLTEKWTALLEKIRKLNGFSHFLGPVPFPTLQNAAAGGPIIMVNISVFQCDAIILVSETPPVVVALHDTSLDELKQFADQLSEGTGNVRSCNAMVTMLRHLWNAIVEPVVKQLTQLKVPEKSHIWWCPTSYLCALPIHAAGLYKKGFKNLPDLYISSYTPTLVSLIRSRSSIPKPQSALSLLLVSQPDDTIPNVVNEINVIQNRGKEVYSCSGPDAHKEAVLAGLQSHSWVHFACHGHLDPQPFNSWFQLYKGEHLTVLDLAKAQLPNAEFAFLSACHSAAGGVNGTPDESIHLAAALQFCGFRSVVGTLWAMVDDDGPAIADAFYKYIFRNTNTVDLRDVAEALNIATMELRKQHVPLDRWINFIHIGA